VVGRRPKQESPHVEASRRICTRVRQLRTDRKWSQQRLAEEARVSYATVRALERQVTTDPGVFTLLSLADALEVSLMDLIGSDPDDQ